ncbi:alkyldihydroxyacetonephosphate synthase [Haloactinospora alba]|uniref:Alkyldihydroxyacetonephosphate synthase n=1 Tax=Haloactinospora alba TaxID=405555 RepID=A0A543NLH6_9ACTN|nr:FAD-binding oxidoreductase [Haloactinospora alba]TQN32705.1 alkyldihydroxyacetonephosphate synthase [Haloactinospora alba]
MSADHATDMSWFAWGDPDYATPLSDSLRGLVADALGAELVELPPPDEEEVRLPDPTLTPAALAELRNVVGEEQVRTDRASRLRHAGGKSTPDLLRRRSGDATNAPDAVLLPGSHDEVLAVLDVCERHHTAVVPFGGGTSVVGGVEPLRGDGVAAVSLDLRRLDRLVAFDPLSQTATLQAGLRTPRAEELLAEHGRTLGHVPQSYEYATIGGYAATRSSGQASLGYGRFDDLVVAMRVATPRGTLEVGGTPASAAGPDLRQLVLGSEGAFGVITEVTLRTRPVPEATHDEAWSFPDFDSGAAALRALTQAAPRPMVARLSDPTETFVNAALSGGGDGGSVGCLLVVGFEGTEQQVSDQHAAARRTLEQEGGTPLGSEPVSQWRHSRFHGPYLRDTLLAAGVLSETLETATTWSGLRPLYEAVTSAVAQALDGPHGTSVVMCHISHVYPTGASLYFTVVTAAGTDPEQRWWAAKRAASDAIAAHGGTISHHHAVGADHRPWMTAEVQPLGVDVLRAVKTALDPAGVLNPGKLIPQDGGS